MKRIVSAILTFIIAFNMFSFVSNDIQVDAKVNWKRIYKKYMNELDINLDNASFYLIYLDNNNVPEVLQLGPMAREMVLYYIVNNKVKTYRPYGYAFAYVRKDGIFYTTFSHMGSTECSLDYFNGKKVKNLHSCGYYYESDESELENCKFDNRDVSYYVLKNSYNEDIVSKLKKARYLDEYANTCYVGKDVFLSKALK